MTNSDTKIAAEWDLMEHAELETPAEKTKCRKETVASLEIAIRAQGADVAKVKHLLKKDSRMRLTINVKQYSSLSKLCKPDIQKMKYKLVT